MSDITAIGPFVHHHCRSSEIVDVKLQVMIA